MIFRCSTFWCAQKVKLFFEAKPLMCLCCFHCFKKVFFSKSEAPKAPRWKPMSGPSPLGDLKEALLVEQMQHLRHQVQTSGSRQTQLFTNRNCRLSQWKLDHNSSDLGGKEDIMNFVHFCNQCCVFCGDRMLGWFCLRYIWLCDVCVFVCFWFASHVFPPGRQDVIWRIVLHIFHVEYTPHINAGEFHRCFSEKKKLKILLLPIHGTGIFSYIWLIW